MSDTTTKDDKLGIEIFTSGELLVEQGIEAIIKLCTQPIISNNPKRNSRVESAVRKVFEAYGVQEQIALIDDLNDTGEIHHSVYDYRIEELKAIKNSQETK